MSFLATSKSKLMAGSVSGLLWIISIESVGLSASGPVSPVTAAGSVSGAAVSATAGWLVSAAVALSTGSSGRGGVVRTTLSSSGTLPATGITEVSIRVSEAMLATFIFQDFLS